MNLVVTGRLNLFAYRLNDFFAQCEARVIWMRVNQVKRNTLGLADVGHAGCTPSCVNRRLCGDCGRCAAISNLSQIFIPAFEVKRCQSYTAYAPVAKLRPTTQTKSVWPLWTGFVISQSDLFNSQ